MIIGQGEQEGERAMSDDIRIAENITYTPQASPHLVPAGVLRIGGVTHHMSPLISPVNIDGEIFQGSAVPFGCEHDRPRASIVSRRVWLMMLDADSRKSGQSE